MSHQPKFIYEFDTFRLEVAERRLCRAEEVIPLPPKAFDLLFVLLEHPGHLLEKEELLQAVWPDAVVEEVNLANTISLLRKAMGEGAHEHRFIETVPRRGYRFVAAVQKSEGSIAELNVIESAPLSAPNAAREPTIARFKRWGRRHVLAVSLSILLLGLVGTLSVWQRKPPPVAAPPFNSLAVLPFKSLQSDGSDEHLGLGLADTLITKLGGLRQLIVRPTSAVRKYNSPEQDPLAAGREQQVDAVLDASLQRNGDKVRVTVRLLKVGDGAALWTYQCDELYCADFFAMQDTISEKVGAALISELTGEERKRLRKRYTENRAAFELYAQGRTVAEKRTSESLQMAERFYQQALDIDPNYTLAHIGLSEIYYLGLASHLQPGNPRAMEEVTKALTIDDTISEAHTALARILWQQEWNWSAAENEFKRALALDPHNAFAHRIYGSYLMSMERHDEALAQKKLALAVDPRSLVINLELGQSLYNAGQIKEALAQFRQTEEMDPTFVETYHRLGEWYLWQGKYAEAIAELEKAIPLSERHAASTLLRIGVSYAKLRKRDEAMKRLAQVKELARQNRVSSYEMAWFYATLEDKEQAFAWLRQGCNERDKYMVYLNVNQGFN